VRLPRFVAPRNSAIDDARRHVAGLDLGAPVAIRVSARARRISLRVLGTGRGVELVLPRGVGPEAGLKFLDGNRGWVAARIAAQPEAVPMPASSTTGTGLREQISSIAAGLPRPRPEPISEPSGITAAQPPSASFWQVTGSSLQ